MFYPKCRAGFEAFGCCVCSPKCPDGMTNIGVSCAKATYTRNMAGCPASMPVNCGLGCAVSDAACALSIVSQVQATGELAVNFGLLATSGGAASAGFAAARAAGKAAGKTVLSQAARAAAKNTIKNRLRNSAARRNLDRADQALGNAAALEDLAEALVRGKEEGEFDYETLLADLDPTGIAAVVNAFNRPICSESPAGPSLSVLSPPRPKRQTWKLTKEFPRQEIQALWKNDLYIAGLAFDGNTWALAMKGDSQWTTQSWMSDSDFPAAKLKAKWDEDHYITHAVHANDQWTLVTTKNTGWTGQSYLTEANFPKDGIQRKWDAGQRITKLAYGGGLWLAVTTEGTGWTEQSWVMNSEFPAEDIKKRWDEDYYITDVTMGDGQWAIVLTKGVGWTNQSYQTSSEFPQTFVEEQFAKGRQITSIEYGKGMWVVVTSQVTR
jgi:hypothetical protein